MEIYFEFEHVRIFRLVLGISFNKTLLDLNLNFFKLTGEFYKLWLSDSLLRLPKRETYPCH